MTDALFEDLGRIGYKGAWDLQLRLHAERVAGQRPDTLLFCEHDPVLTMGKSGKGQNLLVSQDELRRRGVEYYAVERGGDLTFHGPGQLVAYPIFKLPRLREVQAFVRKMEGAIIAALATFGIEAQQRADHAGAFVRDAKIASIGAAVRSGVTYHGLALDVCTDLSHFQLINPCGMPGVAVTSISRELGREVSVADAKTPLLDAMTEVFELNFLLQDVAPQGVVARSLNAHTSAQ
ncbi:MAG: lipoyl(octanoyl) transferase LipB [Candidatus Eremiobacteraeota bacterium]|nr:lipoyl(octanoyl) transferase LipB [Candidatus Eremiobacteraeota bacterium]